MQPPMTPVSRWVARRMGFCRLQPQARKMRPTWEGWYETPSSRRITSATRPRVQMSPRNPKDSAPRLSSSGICARCSAVRRDGPPGALPRRSASTPPSSARFTHWLTAPGVTPSALAMSRCFHPSCFSSQARRRRPSRQSVAWFDNLFSTKPRILLNPEFSKPCTDQ
jgi:hypothetical protein